MATDRQQQLKHGDGSVLRLLLMAALSIGIVFSPILLYRHWQYHQALPAYFTPPANCQVLICHYPLGGEFDSNPNFFIRMHSPHGPHLALKEIVQAVSPAWAGSFTDAHPMTRRELLNHNTWGEFPSYLSHIPSTKNAETYEAFPGCDTIVFYAWPDSKGSTIEVINAVSFPC